MVFKFNTTGSIIDVESQVYKLLICFGSSLEFSFGLLSHFIVSFQYRWIAYASIFIGCCFVSVFHLGTAEPRLVIYVEFDCLTLTFFMWNLEFRHLTFRLPSCRLKTEAHEKGYARISWAFWFHKLLYHQVALVYVLTRLVTNVSQVSI